LAIIGPDPAIAPEIHVHVHVHVYIATVTHGGMDVADEKYDQA